MRVSEFERLGAMLGRIVPGQSESRGGRLATVWAVCVGPEIAQNARPVSLRRGRLVVVASSPAWAHALQLMESDIMERLNAALRGVGETSVCRLAVRAAGWEQVAGGAVARDAAEGPGGRRNDDVSRPSPAGPLTEELECEVQRVQSGACDEELGERVAAAMRAWLARGAAGPTRKGDANS